MMIRLYLLEIANRTAPSIASSSSTEPIALVSAIPPRTSPELSRAMIPMPPKVEPLVNEASQFSLIVPGGGVVHRAMGLDVGEVTLIDSIISVCKLWISNIIAPTDGGRPSYTNLHLARQMTHPIIRILDQVFDEA